MQSDIMQPQKNTQTVTNSVPVAQAPSQPDTQLRQPVNMDIKAEQPKKQVQPQATSQQQPTNVPKKKEKPRSNIGIIIVACLVCAALVGLAIYVKIQNTPVPQ